MKNISHKKFSQALREALTKAKQKGNDSLGDVIKEIHQKGFGLIILLLTLPVFIPILGFAAGTISGLLIITLAIQMLLGYEYPRLFKWMNQIKIPQKMFEDAIWDKNQKFIKFLEKFIYPRTTFKYEGIPYKITCITIIVMSMLITVPIPMTNILPAIALFIIAIGVSEKDGLFTFVGIIFSWLAIIFYLWIFYLGACLVQKIIL